MKNILDHLHETIGLTQAERDQAKAVHRKSGARAAEYLAHRGNLSEPELIDFLCDHLKIDRYTPEKYPPAPALKNDVKLDVALKYNIVPLKKDQDRLWIGTGAPTDVIMLESLERLTGLEVEPVYIPAENIDELLRAFYDLSSDVREIYKTYSEFESSTAPEKSDDEDTGLDTNQPADNLVRQILAEAMREHASHIHITPKRQSFELHFRIDGQLRELVFPNKSALAPVISRLKHSAGMDLASARVPQAGAFAFKSDGRDVSVKANSIPTTRGESMVLRLFPRNGTGHLRLGQVGLSPTDDDKIRQALRKRTGLILVSGPEGGGKTTMLYALLRHLDNGALRIFTLEDPVACDVETISQVQFNPKTDLSFASQTRAVVAQNPDVLMVSELRDAETASEALKSVWRGMRVFGAVQAFSAAGAIGRLLDTGVRPIDLACGLSVSISLRLIPTICRECSTPDTPPEELLRLVPQDILANAAFKRGKGCPSCNNTGFKGKTGVFEILQADDATRELILKSASYLEIHRAARAAGSLTTLAEDAMRKAAAGLTTLAEATRLV